MSRRVALALLTVAVTIGAAFLVLAVTGRGSAGPDESSPVWSATAGAVYLFLGALLVVRRPTLVMPWLLVAFGVCLCASAALDGAGLADERGWQRLDVMLYISFGAIIALIVQLFPTGRPLAGGWRWVTTSMLVGWGLLVLGQAFGVDVERLQPWMRIPLIAVVALYTAGLLGALPALAVRFHRSRSVERAQLKWFLFSVVLLVAGWFVPDDFLGTPDRSITNVASILPAAAITVALLRYHLYDIDRIISRTTSYAIVTALVLGTYLVVVTVVLRLLPDLSNLAVATATLAAAAVVRPAVHRVQRLVDRRFDRSRYDQIRILEAFGIHVRDLVDPEDVTRQLMVTVRTALQPSSVALIARPAAGTGERS